jgi:hypothetical protein
MPQILVMEFVRWFPVVAVFWLAAVFAWRRLWRELPLFFVYLIASLLFVATRYVALYLGRKPYFYTFWISDLVASIVVFFPLYEVFVRRLFQRFQRVRFYRRLFPLTAVVILVLTIFAAADAQDKSAAFQAASRAFDFMRTAVLVFFIGLMMFMGRQWDRYDLGIALGFGVQAALALADSAVQARMHSTPSILYTAELFAYNLSCVIWLITFWKPKNAPHGTPAELDPQILHEARTWEATLKNWLLPGKNRR